jgi:GDP-L-fucose synthase
MDTKYLFKIHQPEYVIHTAARVGGVGANMKANAEFFYDNVMMNTNVIEVCRVNNVKRAAFFLSTCVFPDKVEYPLTEEKIHLGPGHPSNYGYSYAKRMAEVQVRSYNDQYKTNYFCVIPCNIYGPGDNFSLENGHVIPSLIHKVYLAKQNNTDLEVWGDGSPLREFIYSKDVARITEKLLYETNFTGNIIVSNSFEWSIKDVVGMICEIMDFKGNIVWLKDKPNGQLKKPSDNSKLHAWIGNPNFTPLVKGLEETIGWFETNYANVRK